MSEAPLEPVAARALVLAEARPTETELVGIGGCLGRVAAAPAHSEAAAPGFDNSAMDGYALRSADTAGSPRPLRLVGESRAGHPAAAGPGPGEAVRISTGAMLPPGADAVLPLEEAREAGGEVLPGRPVEPGACVRRSGEDFAAGQLLLGPGRRLGAAELGVLAGAGIGALECARVPRLAVLTSGDELIAPGEPLGPGQIHNTSRFSLPALAVEAGAEAEHRGTLPDEEGAARAGLAAALDAGPDVLVVAGGVSVGRHDHVKAGLAQLGVRQRFWRVAMRPGGPTWFGVLEAEPGRRPTLVFGLPGNPVSAMVTFQLFVRPALAALVGLDPDAQRVPATLAAAYEKSAGKAHFIRCRIETGASGRVAHLTRREQGSHLLTSMLDADALAEIPLAAERLAAGERVEVELLR